MNTLRTCSWHLSLVEKCSDVLPSNILFCGKVKSTSSSFTTRKSYLLILTFILHKNLILTGRSSWFFHPFQAVLFLSKSCRHLAVTRHRWSNTVCSINSVVYSIISREFGMMTDTVAVAIWWQSVVGVGSLLGECLYMDAISFWNLKDMVEMYMDTIALLQKRIYSAMYY